MVPAFSFWTCCCSRGNRPSPAAALLHWRKKTTIRAQWRWEPWRNCCLVHSTSPVRPHVEYGHPLHTWRDLDRHDRTCPDRPLESHVCDGRKPDRDLAIAPRHTRSLPEFGAADLPGTLSDGNGSPRPRGV